MTGKREEYRSFLPRPFSTVLTLFDEHVISAPTSSQKKLFSLFNMAQCDIPGSCIVHSMCDTGYLIDFWFAFLWMKTGSVTWSQFASNSEGRI